MICQLQVPTSFAVWLGGFLFLLVVVDRCLSIWKNHFREQPRPHLTYATKEEANRINRRIDLFDEKLDTLVEKMEGRRSQNVARLHEKIDTAFSELRKEVKQDIKGVHSRQDTILEYLAKSK